jgi:phenylacetic acid degradation operon negative regulatory protein
MKFAAVACSLMRAFVQRRPLRGGSLITTIFGDSLASRHCDVSLSGLIVLLEPFGLTGRLVRTSIGRLAQGRWVTSKRIGRLSYYRLTAAGEIRFAEATRKIYGAPREDWRGRWATLILPAETGREAREHIRNILQWSGFGQLCPGVHIHPEIRLEAAQTLVAGCSSQMQPVLLESRSIDADADRRMVELGWDLDSLERRYTKFITSFVPALDALSKERNPEPMHCFHIRTLLIHEYRKVHLLDPLLPPRLLPRDWAGSAAYELCKRLYLAISERSDQYVQSVLRSSSGPLPPPSAETRNRFTSP